MPQMYGKLSGKLRISETPDFSELLERLVTEYEFRLQDVLEESVLKSREPAINLFSTENVRTGTDALGNTTGFTLVAATGLLASSTTHAQGGSRSLRFKSYSPGDYFETEHITIGKNTDIVASFYWLKDISENGKDLTVELMSGAGTLDTLSIDVSGTSFQRAELSGATGASSTAVWIRITANFLIGAPLAAAYFDGFQLERGTTATDWVNPGGDGDTAMFSAVDLYMLQNESDEVTATVRWLSTGNGSNDNRSEVGPGQLLILTDVDPSAGLPVITFDDDGDTCPGRLVVVGTA